MIDGNDVLVRASVFRPFAPEGDIIATLGLPSGHPGSSRAAAGSPARTASRQSQQTFCITLSWAGHARNRRRPRDRAQRRPIDSRDPPGAGVRVEQRPRVADAAGPCGGTVGRACRDATRGEAARQEIIRASGKPRVFLEIVDLASEASTRSLAEAFPRKYPRLDVLINNAGVYTSHREITPDGLERQFEVNYLSGFLLTHLMLDLLKKSAPSRIVNVSSSAHGPSAIHFDDLQVERRYSGYRAYGQSKLAQILSARELARRLEGTGVTVNACHPGVIRTNLGIGGAPGV